MAPTLPTHLSWTSPVAVIRCGNRKPVCARPPRSSWKRLPARVPSKTSWLKPVSRNAAIPTARGAFSRRKRSAWHSRWAPKARRMPRITPIRYRKLARVLELEGFMLVRQRGDHMVFAKKGIERPVVVPRYDPLPVFIIKNVLGRRASPASAISSCWNASKLLASPQTSPLLSPEAPALDPKSKNAQNAPSLDPCLAKINCPEVRHARRARPERSRRSGFWTPEGFAGGEGLVLVIPELTLSGADPWTVEYRQIVEAAA